MLSKALLSQQAESLYKSLRKQAIKADRLCVKIESKRRASYVVFKRGTLPESSVLNPLHVRELITAGYLSETYPGNHANCYHLH